MTHRCSGHGPPWCPGLCAVVSRPGSVGPVGGPAGPSASRLVSTGVPGVALWPGVVPACVPVTSRPVSVFIPFSIVRNTNWFPLPQTPLPIRKDGRAGSYPAKSVEKRNLFVLLGCRLFAACSDRHPSGSRSDARHALDRPPTGARAAHKWSPNHIEQELRLRHFSQAETPI